MKPCARFFAQLGSRMSQTATPPPISAAKINTATKTLEEDAPRAAAGSGVEVVVGMGNETLSGGDEITNGVAVTISGAETISKVGVCGAVAGWVAPRLTSSFCPC